MHVWPQASYIHLTALYLFSLQMLIGVEGSYIGIFSPDFMPQIIPPEASSIFKWTRTAFAKINSETTSGPLSKKQNNFFLVKLFMNLLFQLKKCPKRLCFICASITRGPSARSLFLLHFLHTWTSEQDESGAMLRAFGRVHSWQVAAHQVCLRVNLHNYARLCTRMCSILSASEFALVSTNVRGPRVRTPKLGWFG